MTMLCAVLLCLVGLVSATDGARAQDIFEGEATVIDGDTLSIDGHRFHLYGVDAFERDQICWDGENAYPCGEIARGMLTEMVERAKENGNGDLWCIRMPVERDHEAVAKCLIGRQVDLGAAMVAQGFALAYPPETDFYTAEEFAAQLDARGSLGHLYYTPWDWRAMSAAERAHPPQ
jgi:endonuclease YncB( thermonuclease family)